MSKKEKFSMNFYWKNIFYDVAIVSQLFSEFFY